MGERLDATGDNLKETAANLGKVGLGLVLGAGAYGYGLLTIRRQVRELDARDAAREFAANGGFDQQAAENTVAASAPRDSEPALDAMEQQLLGANGPALRTATVEEIAADLDVEEYERWYGKITGQGDQQATEQVVRQPSE